MPDRALQISIDNLLEGVQVIGQDWTYRYINRAAAAQGEKTVGELLGANLFEAYPQIRDSELHKHLATVMERREQRRVLNEFVLPSGVTRWFELLIEPAPDGIIVLSIDVSERHAAELERRQAVRLETLGQLAGGVAHDFNNLLTVILGYTELLSEQAESPAMRADIEAITEAAKRAASMTRQLLTFSRGHAPQLTSVSLDTVVREVEPMLCRLLPENVRIRTTVNSGLWTVTADKTELEQVLMNLTINARDAMPEGGILSIETSNVSLEGNDAKQHPALEAGDYAVLTVSDTGVGMPPEIQARIFEPFFTTKDPGRGTGLGLAAVKRMVTQLQGHIHVYSEQGRGSEFRIYLCRTMTAPAPPAVSGATASLPATGRILLVEDDAHVREFASRVLERAGYVVVRATSGEEGLALLAEEDHAFDILLTDLMLGGMNGFELAREVKALHPEIKSIFMSGYAEPALANAVADARIVEKPFTAKALLAALQQFDS